MQNAPWQGAKTPGESHFDIRFLGAFGDGMGENGAEKRAFPGALPGERVRLTRDESGAEQIEILKTSPERIAPICPLFLECGGCAFQHLRESGVAAWKTERIRQALAKETLNTTIAPLIDAHGAGRRRTILHLRGSQAGFMRARSHVLIDLDSCPLFEPALAGVPALAREIGAALAGLGKPIDLQATSSDQGLDLDLRGVGKLPEALRLKLVGLATRHDLARLTLHGARLIEARPPSLTLERFPINMDRKAAPSSGFGAFSSGEPVPPSLENASDGIGLTAFLPPGAFLQASAAAEAILARLAIDGLAGARHVADLFCGFGPFALRLSRRMKVAAFDADKPAIEALGRSIRANPGGKPIRAQARDLFRRPLFQPELTEFDAALLNPPRQGAEAQCREIAKSRLSRLVYISCDPESFARDARILVEAGFRLAEVTPVDQFRFSTHIELVARFERGK